MLGFAAKAGQLVTGSTAVEVALKKHRVYLVICATDLAARTVKKFNSLCQFHRIAFYNFSTRSELGQWIGIPERGVIGVVSKQFAGTIGRLLDDLREQENEKPLNETT